MPWPIQRQRYVLARGSKDLHGNLVGKDLANTREEEIALLTHDE